LILSFCIWADGQSYHIIFNFFGDTVFMFFIVLTILMEAYHSYRHKIEHDKRWGVAAVASICIAFFIWNISQTGTPLCDPYSPIQGHAIWHILDAVSTFCLFRFYASEQSGSVTVR
jgi:hypothetical protein